MKVELLAAVDPGVREAGVAVFEGGKLARVEFVREDYGSGPAQIDRMARALYVACGGEDAGAIVCETMVFRSGRTDAAQDIVDVQTVVGALIGWAGGEAVSLVAPGDWTSKRSKTVNHVRIRSRLDAEETARLEAGLARCPKANHKEILDAVGIGLYALRRL